MPEQSVAVCASEYEPLEGLITVQQTVCDVRLLNTPLAVCTENYACLCFSWEMLH